MNGRFTLFPGLPGAESPSLNSAEETLLQQQSIDAQHPGAILHDFHVLLEFLSPNGTEISQGLHRKEVIVVVLLPDHPARSAAPLLRSFGQWTIRL